MEVALLTGDRQAVAAKVARQLGVREFVAELLPEQKLERVQQLIRSGKHVAMVGDGINEAPALTEATVGIAMGSSTDLARHSASVLLCWETIWLIAPNSWLSRGAAAAYSVQFLGNSSRGCDRSRIGGCRNSFTPASRGGPCFVRDGVHSEFRPPGTVVETQAAIV